VQRLLVTGGCGTLGTELVRQAPGRGWDVRATWWQREPAAPADWVRLDVRDAAAVRAAVAGCDAVVHTAYRQNEDAWSINVDGSEAVARAVEGRRLVHLSTDLVFDGTRGRYVETDETAPVSEYGRSKEEAERRVAVAAPEAALVRTSLIYGVPDGPQERLAREGTSFFVDEIRSPVHVADLAGAVLDLLERHHAGPLHVAGADDVDRHTFALLLGADPGRIREAHTTPDRAPDVSLDSARARGLLPTRLRGVYEVLGPPPSSSAVRSAR
jgi:dTDP-4-dehydrorhamnose reductase